MASQANKRPMAVYIGRFSLFHNGHAAVLLRALKAYDTVVVIVGSDRTPRTIKNPWTAAERADLILSWYEAQQKRRSGALGTLILETNRDFPYNNDLWLAEVQRIIADSTHPNLNGPIYITGAKRDDTGFYLDMFPSPTYELDLVDEDTSVSKFLTATWCREIYLARSFNGTALNDREYDLMLRAFVPEETMKFLSEFQRKNSLIADPSLPMDLHLAEVAARDMPKYLGVAPAFDYLLHEHKVTTARRAEIAGKYEPVTLTADAVVIRARAAH
jgi:bifunctional NMN adenylyltransferase/nudix hydrolase